MVNESRSQHGVLFETNHGVLAEQYNEMKDHTCMSNPSATIYVWAQCLKHCADKEHNFKLKVFAQQLIDSLHACVDA
jgi:isocitrate dehydrogenase